MSDTSEAARIALAWQEAANAKDIERLLALSDTDIEIAGPRGAGRGHALLREWLARAGIELRALRLFGRGGAIVVEQRALWRDAETGAVTGERALASAFAVSGGRVARLSRHDELPEALRAASLTEADLLPGP